MNGPDDTLPPSSGLTCPGTEDISELPIVAGSAAHTMMAAISNLVAAVVNVEKVALACARAVDASATKEPTP